jgi:hypothetical protein
MEQDPLPNRQVEPNRRLAYWLIAPAYVATGDKNTDQRFNS